MTAPAAIRGTFVNMITVRSRSVVQFIVEVPIEHSTEALNALGGVPQPSKEPWVALALLDLSKAQEPAKQPPPAKERRHFSELSPATQAALKCKEGAFQKFVCEKYEPGQLPNEDLAADVVRDICGVISRASLNTDPGAAERWHRLLNEFFVWMHEDAVI